jgi:putative heme-binding domain-containing protein
MEFKLIADDVRRVLAGCSRSLVVTFRSPLPTKAWGEGTRKVPEIGRPPINDCTFRREGLTCFLARFVNHVEFIDIESRSMRTPVLPAGIALSLIVLLLIARAADPIQPSTSFPEPTNSEADTAARPMSPDEAARGFRVPDGFQVTVFAAEPDVQNPIAMAWDARGRLWIAENYTYADRTKKFDLSLRDRVLIFEDVDGDGRFDKRTVFTDDVQMLTSIAIGFGGAWLMTPPQLLFIPDRDGDDKPDGAPVVMLDGFTPATDNHHTFANGLKWGPDGWLYGRCGASSPGRLGVPGTPDELRVPLFGGVWRFRPGRDGAPLVSSLPSSGARVGGRSGDDNSLHQTAKEETPDPLRSKARGEGTRSIVEVLSHGTTNPWGMDWNEYGEAFFINTVNGHLWHVIPGAHFRRPHSEDPNPYVYETIDTHADHYHWDTGKDWTDSRNVTGEHDRLGGGHAHSGATIYLGDNWPDSYRGRLLTLNLHGRRVNVERLERDGGGYSARHEPDMLFAADPWFRGIDLSYGPDGAVLLLDWSDTGECHEHTGVHRTSGRIYKVTHGPAKAVEPKLRDLTKLDSSELVSLHRHRNEWFVRQARLVLADRLNAASDEMSRAAVCSELQTLFDSEPDVVVKLRAMQTLFVLGSTDEPFLLEQLNHPDEHVRAWAVRLLTDAWPLDTIMGQLHPMAKELARRDFNVQRGASDPAATASLRRLDAILHELIRLAREDKSGLVRLTLASTLQRLPIKKRIELAKPLASRADDASDHNLPLMVWYGVMPVLTPLAPAVRRDGLGERGGSVVVRSDELQVNPSDQPTKPGESSAKQSTPDPLSAEPGRGDKAVPMESRAQDGSEALARFACECRFPITRRLIARRLAEMIDEQPKSVETLLAGAADAATLSDILAGLTDGFSGRHKVNAPANWDAVQQRLARSPEADLREHVRDLSVLFGDGRALDEVKRVALDGKQDLASRRVALQTLIDVRAPERRKICEQLLSVRYLNTTAVRGLTEFDDPAIGEKLAKSYRSFFPSDRPAVIDALVTRPSFAEPLLEQIAAGRIPRSDLTVFHARQIRSFNDHKLTQKLTEVWGELRDSPDDKRALIAKLKLQLTTESLAAADKSQGRVVFAKVCANCHRLYGHGAQIGPDLTGSGRQNLDYVLLNLVDPSAAVGADYRMTVAVMKDGRVLNGLVIAKSERVLTLQTARERQTIERDEIEELRPSSQSLMPDGLLQPLTETQIRDLVAYLMHPTQVPLAGGE